MNFGQNFCEIRVDKDFDRTKKTITIKKLIKHIHYKNVKVVSFKIHTDIKF